MSDGAVPLIPPLPEYEKKTESGDTTTRGGGTEEKRLSPVQQQALTGLDTATNEQIAGTDEVRKQKEAENALSAQMADQQAKLAEVQQGRTDAAIDQGSKLINDVVTRTKAEQAKLDAMPPPKYFRDGDTWGNALRGLALALGAAGDAMRVGAAVRVGQAAPSLNTVQGIIESDLAEQKDLIKRQSDRVVAARAGMADAVAARERLLADVDLRGQAAYKRLESVARARLAALGMKAPEIEQHQTVLALKAARAQKQADYVAPAWQSVSRTWQDAHKTGMEETNRASTGAGAKPTERQQSDAFLGKNLNDQLDIIESNPALSESALSKSQNQELEMHAADKSAAGGVVGNLAVRAGRAIGAVTKSQTEGMTPEEQKVVTAYNVAKEMVARRLSGGAIVSDEDRQNAEKYMEHAGDSPELRAQKRQMLRNMANELMTLAGPAGQQLGGAQKSPAPTQPPPFQQGGPGPSGSHTPAPAGSTPAPATNPARDLAVKAVRSNPSDPRSGPLRRYWNITDEELR